MQFDQDRSYGRSFINNIHKTYKIVNVSADTAIIDENGNIHAKKLDAIVFDPIGSAYLRLGEKVGNAFKDGTKRNKTC